jgi:hypothetical protein
MENGPEPAIKRNNKPSSMQKSVLASCMVAQNPALESIGILVVAIATEMSMRSGTEARLVSRPRISIVPHTISTTPTNGAKNWGRGNADFREASHA